MFPIRTFVLSLLYLGTTAAFAAKPIDLKHQSIDTLQTLTSRTQTNQITFKETSRSIDFKKTTHIRAKEMYAGFPVWGGDFIIHAPQGTSTNLTSLLSSTMSSSVKLNGIIYQDLQKDLENTAAFVFTADQAKKASSQAIANFHKISTIDAKPANVKENLIVYIDKNQKAHWAYLVKFDMKPIAGMPAKPVYIIDATSLRIYQHWDEIKTVEDADGGGFGGNEKMGQLTYDGLQDALPKLHIQRDPASKICYFQNQDVVVYDARNGGQVYQFPCEQSDSQYGNVFWNGNADAANGAFSPADDALFTGAVVKDMYSKWYGVPVLVEEDGKPMVLGMNVHYHMENAYWDGRMMTFGDGGDKFYPLVSLGVAAHEVSHGFTQQHSNLAYYAQSGGLNEAFSDMAAQAAEYYAYGHNSWQIGPEIYKASGKALRYMDEPTKDCSYGQPPGWWCSISHMKDYNDGIDVHHTSGVFNKAFYLLGTAAGWDTKKAFDVMVHANQHYWTPNTTFAEAACGVMSSAKDYQYNTEAVVAAMQGVGIDVSSC